MVARVLLVPRLLDSPPSDVTSGTSVRGITFRRMGGLINWVNGRGAALVPATAPGGGTIAASASKTYRFRVFPRLQALRRLWAVRMRRATTDEGRSVTVRIPDTGSPRARSVATKGAGTQPLLFLEDVLTPSASEQELSIKITNDGTDAIIVEGISVHELPRARLDIDSTEFGLDIDTVRGGDAIFDDVGLSAGGLDESIKAAETIARRCGYFHWVVDVGDAAKFTSGSPTDFFQLEPPFLGRKENRDDVVSETTWRIYAANTDGTTAGTFDVTMTSGDTLTITIPAGTTSFTWLPASGGTLDVDAEDHSTADGRRGGAFDGADVTVTRTAGAGTVEIAVISVAEAT